MGKKKKHPQQPVGWKSDGAKRAEQLGLMRSEQLAGFLKVPTEFVRACMAPHERHHVQGKRGVFLARYYEPRHAKNWFESESGKYIFLKWTAEQKTKA